MQFREGSHQVKSGVTASLLRRSLFRGLPLCCVGAFFFLAGGAVLTPDQLLGWGVLIILAGFFFLAWGLIPYRRLLQLQEQPHEVHLSPEFLTFCTKGKPHFSIPLKSIESASFVDRDGSYGIGVSLKRPIPKKICVHHAGFDMDRFQKNSQEHYSCDCFFPHFTQRSFESLKSL